MRRPMGWLQLSIGCLLLSVAYSLREFRQYSEREPCSVIEDLHYPFAFSKYAGQTVESKGRVNSNRQDFRHECQVLGGASKCHICEAIECNSELGICQLQLQGVDSNLMSVNIPVVSDTAWAVGGRYRHDFAYEGTSHFCVFLTGGVCLDPYNTDYSSCLTRCFGFGFDSPAVKGIATERSVVDQYPGMNRWSDDGQVDLWRLPQNCSELESWQGRQCQYSGEFNQIPSFNPQGFTWTLAGDGEEGFLDGLTTEARFAFPEDAVIDEYGGMFIADTGNNAIRYISPTGIVSTIAGQGKGKTGYEDGPCSTATFSSPKGIDILWTDTSSISSPSVQIAVADTGNHRIRRIDWNPTSGSCEVICLAGLCGNNTLSASEMVYRAPPMTGFADGFGNISRFSAPESVTYTEDGTSIVVADTGNWLLRWVDSTTGNTSTLAGTLVPGERGIDGKPLAGCTPPCMVGLQGFEDGDLHSAKFYNPVDVTRGPNNSIWVADEHRIRKVDIPDQESIFLGISSRARVSTIAGNSLQGYADGIAQNATFFSTGGVVVDPDGRAFVVDTGTCRIRRITPYQLVSQKITCSTPLSILMRPSGCTSYDMPVDEIGRKVSRVEGNIQYNFGSPYEEIGDLDRGKYIKNCVGVPPFDVLDKRFINVTGDNLVIDDHRVAINEFSEQGMAILVTCSEDETSLTGTCLSQSSNIAGTGWYSEDSSICFAAVHNGVMNSGEEALLLVTVQRRDYLAIDMQTNDPTAASVALSGSTQHGLTSVDIPEDVPRVFTIARYNVSNVMVHTVAGRPSAPLENKCGYEDAQPSTLARFDGPKGLTIRPGKRLSDAEFLYIVDTNNHRIRAVSATCTFICENGGTCVGDDQCECPLGWGGVDCTLPQCSFPCGPNGVCVAPDSCACKPGYAGLDCTEARCEQTCANGGTCSAPNTCSCPVGWFDANCSTPVCSQTCANGGNCTSPNTCACPSQWTGPDCRIPVCEQTCLNSGFCVAPNTCACPPQWTSYDCSSPVCHQGFFEAMITETDDDGLLGNGGKPLPYYTVGVPAKPTFKNCDLQSWCHHTNEFECDQAEYSYDILSVPSGPLHRATTGQKVPPTACMNIELPLDFKLPFQLVYANNDTTGHVRYSPFTPYESDPLNPWRGYFEPTEDHTGPWTYTADRQVANVYWLNVSQGRYVCANGGSCVEPDVCSCAPGWTGFDCRTPICEQGYYRPDQPSYVSGLETPNEIQIFEKYLGSNSYRLNWPYSNPSYKVEHEFYSNRSYVERELRDFDGKRYLGGTLTYSEDGTFTASLQGGFRCTIRADTEWEGEGHVFEHPNFYSQYMDEVVQDDFLTYTYWQDMAWPPTHRKSRILDRYEFGIQFAYTNEGWRRRGIWSTTDVPWQFGVCVVEFERNCTDMPLKAKDLESQLVGVLVQDTDLAYRQRITYNDLTINSQGRWQESTGQCVDQVVRGCANNGTCIAPNTCRCGEGWEGYDCRTPICEQTCHHHGNCTSPNICTCERGWSGFDCSIPLCSQECQNGGVCVAPDTCQCYQWDNTYRDGRVAGGRPLYQDFDGNPLKTGWTGFDCSVPICVQAETFLLNSDTDIHSMGGHGADTLMECTDFDTGAELPRCPQYDRMLTSNDGLSYQTGCGWDPYDTGCCILRPNNYIDCYQCKVDMIRVTDHTYYCDEDFTIYSGQITEKDTFAAFLDSNRNFRMCGTYHSPRDYTEGVIPQDYGVAKYFYDVLYPHQSNFNFKSNWTSNRFMCGIHEWVQGDYIDDANLGDIVGAGSVYGLSNGRHVRINSPNIVMDPSGALVRGPILAGEGIYRCYNNGSCIAPDTCTCTDGYDGYDCKTPLCRHRQPTGLITACLNGGVCVSKDHCDCIQTSSVLWEVHPGAERGLTGWTGADCSIPMCVQGYYDPFCNDLPQAPAGQGCYRCSNGGNCTAPDVCTCAPGWTGFDCKTPVCEVVADPLTRLQLGTIHEYKIQSFESDPCAVRSIYGVRGWKGRKYTRGNCTQPNQCTCLCRIPYDRRACRKRGILCDGPWQDDMVRVRDLLSARGPQYTFGSTDCRFGYEGNVDELDRFTTCHQTIYLPTSAEENSLMLIIIFSVLGAVGIIGYRFVSVRLKRKMLLAKIERRKTKRSSEESILHSS